MYCLNALQEHKQLEYQVDLYDGFPATSLILWHFRHLSSETILSIPKVYTK